MRNNREGKVVSKYLPRRETIGDTKESYDTHTHEATEGPSLQPKFGET